MTNNRRNGFTLVELTLVMAFMSILLLAILYLTIHAGSLYTKGVTNKTLNQIGREVNDVMKRDMIGADSNRMQIVPETGSGDKKSGRLCTGTVTYIWNTAPLLDDTVATKVKLSTGEAITFRRVEDPTGTLCVPSGGVYPMTIPVSMKSSELLSSSGRDYAIYTMTASSIAKDSTGKGLVSIDMTLGTNEQGTTQKDLVSGFQCLPPTDNSANFDYCTVQEFITVLRVGGNN
jgi:prepilin-type N-terminal cleavage/methylation domain-containing protein